MFGPSPGNNQRSASSPGRNIADVFANRFHQLIGRVDGALTTVLRWPYLDLFAVGPLDLTRNADLTLEEIDVTHLECRSFAEAQTPEGAQTDERREVRMSLTQQLPNLSGGGDRHRR